jgi:hypothetical protein
MSRVGYSAMSWSPSPVMAENNDNAVGMFITLFKANNARFDEMVLTFSQWFESAIETDERFPFPESQ